MQDTVSFGISGASQYIISTSGRLSSISRYQRLLQRKLGLDLVYLPISAKDGNDKIEPEDFVNAITGLGAVGGAISKDIKTRVIPFLDELDNSAQQVQSVNTVVRKGKKLIGYNTDVIGFRHAIERGIAESGESVQSAVIYGYGGVFNVANSVLQNLGLKTYVAGRNQEKVVATEKQFGLDPFDGKADLFVNATPVTDDPLSAASGFLEAIESAKLVFDHHMPGEELKAHSLRTGKGYIPGTSMYHPQMIAQWKLFLQAHADEQVVEDALRSLI